MMQLEVAGKRYPVAAGETVIGSAPGAAILLSGEGVRPRHAVVQATSEGTAAIRPAEPGADLLINGVRLGTDPTPVLHGDKIQIAGHEILAVDPNRAGSTQLFDSGAFSDLIPRNVAKPAAAASGGRLVCLTDGREYGIESGTLVFGRDASADVVVSGNEVSRRHAEITTTADGYVLMDLSVNGTYVNGQRVGRSHRLARADVIRIGHDEFRFYADAAPAQAPMPPRVAPAEPIRPPTGAGNRLSDTLIGLPSEALKESETPTPVQPTVVPIASILVRTGSLRGRRMPIRTPVVNVGRADFNDIVLAEPSVSTTHAKLQRRDGLWVISDLGSTNGTYVEGEPVAGETPLAPGTTIRFGDVAVLFEPHDDVAVPLVSGTQVLERVEAESARPPEAEEAHPAEPRPLRRPIRASAPKPSGPPAWLVALLVLLGLVVAYFLLTS
ncbi:MAG TPA: FHA domain-containing protein [Gemmatimonadales bacterium]|jgi:FOG: FHA domain